MKTKILALILIIFLVGCTAPKSSESDDFDILDSENNFNAKYNYEVADTSMYELTENDIFDMLSKRLIKSTNVAVKGIKLGNRYMDVQKKLGVPDYVEDFYDGTTNLKYEKDGEAYMIVHLEDNTVTRIVVRASMEDELIGKSKIAWTLESIIGLFGKPSEFEDTKYVRIYRYKPRGLEIYLKKREMVSFGFVPPEKL